MPALGIVGGKPNFDAYYITVNHSQIKFGSFATTVVSFLIIAAVIFFFVLQPINALMALRKTEPPVGPTTRDCPFCLSSIPLKATRCAFCTSEVVPAVAPVAVAAKNAKE